MEHWLKSNWLKRNIIVEKLEHWLKRNIIVEKGSNWWKKLAYK